MPEPRDRLPGRWVGDWSPGLASRPELSLREVSRVGNGERWSSTDNKVNILPGGGRHRRGGAARNRPKRSPLPAWYPRTPLRDITHIANIMELRRSRQQSANNSTERNHPIAAEIMAVPLASPLTPSSDDSEEALLPIQGSASSESDLSLLSSPVKPKILESKPQPVDTFSLLKSTMGAMDQNFDMGNLNLEELERLVKEKLQIVTRKQVEKKPRRSILMLMR